MPSNESQFNVVSPEGDLGTVPPEQLDSALQAGFTKPTAQQLSDYNDKQLYNDKFLKTGAVSAVQSALPFGVGAAGLRAAGISGEEQQKLQQYNPASSLAGTAAGLFAPGVGLAKVAGRVGEAAAGLSKLVGLGEDAGVASKIVTQLARGAAEGATYGASNVANDAVTGDPSLVAQHALSEIGTSALWGAGISGALGLGSVAIPKGVSTAKSALGSLSDSLGLTPAMKALKNAGTEAYANVSSAFSGIPKDKIIEAIQNIGKEPEALDPIGFAKDLQDLHNSTEAALKEAVNDYDNLTPQTQEAISKYITSVDSTRATGDYAKQFMYKNAAGELKVDPGKVENFLKNTNTARGAKAASIYADYVSNTSNLMDSIEHEYSLGSSPVDPDLNSVRNLVEKNKGVLENQQDSVLAAKLAQQGAGSGGLGEAAGVGVAGHLLGLPGPLIGAITGTLEVLRNPIEAIDKVAKLQKVVSSSADRLGKLADAVASSSGSSLGGAVKGYVAGQAAIPDAKEYEKVSNKITALNNDFQGTADRIHANTQVLEPHAPAIADSMRQTAGTALSFLSNKIKSLTPPGPLATKPEPSKAQIASFSKSYEAVERPLSILKEAAKGTLTHEGVEAVAAVHPALFNSMKQAIMSSLANNKKADKMPYHRKLMLSLLLGQDLDGSTNPVSMAANQQMLGIAAAQEAQKQQAFIGTPKPTSKGLREINIGNRALTAQQATAQRSEA